MIVRSLSLELHGQNHPGLVVELHDGQTNQPFGWCHFDLKQSNSNTLLTLNIAEIAFKQMEFIKVKWRAPENRWYCLKLSKLDWKEKRAMQPLAIN